MLKNAAGWIELRRRQSKRRQRKLANGAKETSQVAWIYCQIERLSVEYLTTTEKEWPFLCRLNSIWTSFFVFFLRREPRNVSLVSDLKSMPHPALSFVYPFSGRATTWFSNCRIYRWKTGGLCFVYVLGVGHISHPFFVFHCGWFLREIGVFLLGYQGV